MLKRSHSAARPKLARPINMKVVEEAAKRIVPTRRNGTPLKSLSAGDSKEGKHLGVGISQIRIDKLNGRSMAVPTIHPAFASRSCRRRNRLELRDPLLPARKAIHVPIRVRKQIGVNRYYWPARRVSCQRSDRRRISTRSFSRYACW